MNKIYELFKPLSIPKMEDVRQYAEYIYLTSVNKNHGERDETVKTIVSDSNLNDIDAAALIAAVCVLEERSDETLLKEFEHTIQERAQRFISQKEEVDRHLAAYGMDMVTPLPSWAPRRPYRHVMRSKIAHHYMELFGFPDDDKWLCEEFDSKIWPMDQIAYNLLLTDEEATSLMTALWIIDGGENMEEFLKWPLRECVKDRIRYYVQNPDAAEKTRVEYNELSTNLHEKTH